MNEVLTHVRRYPRWYAIALVWLVAMVALPIVRADPLDLFTPDSPAPAAAGGPATGAAPIGGAPTGSPTFGAPDASGGAASDDTPTGTGDEAVGPDEPNDDALQLVPPEVLDLIFDALPPVIAPPLPPELATLANAIAPVATFGCSGLGLASVVIAVVAQSAEGVPVARLLPYLAPVVTACATFPIPPVSTVCAADVPLVMDLGGLTKTPPILGLGIDQIETLERLVAATFGQSIPSTAAALREALKCQLVAS